LRSAHPRKYPSGYQTFLHLPKLGRRKRLTSLPDQNQYRVVSEGKFGLLENLFQLSSGEVFLLPSAG